MRNFIDSLKARRDAAKNEGGFSLIDVVVTVAIIVALSVGGFVTYTGIVDNAKAAATASAADQVYTAITVANTEGGFGTEADILKDYNDSANGTIVVYAGVNADGDKEVIAVHKDKKAAAVVTDYASASTADVAGNADLIVARG